jgi:hypothetical protein
MEPPRIKLSRPELVQKLLLGVTIALSRHRSTASDLMNPRDTEAADRKRRDAARRIAEHLANDFEVSKHEVTRPAVSADSEMLLARLLEGKGDRD